MDSSFWSRESPQKRDYKTNYVTISQTISVERWVFCSHRVYNIQAMVFISVLFLEDFNLPWSGSIHYQPILSSVTSPVTTTLETNQNISKPVILQDIDHHLMNERPECSFIYTATTHVTANHNGSSVCINIGHSCSAAVRILLRLWWILRLWWSAAILLIDQYSCCVSGIRCCQLLFRLAICLWIFTFFIVFIVNIETYSTCGCGKCWLTDLFFVVYSTSSWVRNQREIEGISVVILASGLKSYVQAYFNGGKLQVGQIRYGAYAWAAGLLVHLATVVIRPPYHCCHKRRIRHDVILQTGLHLTQTRNMQLALDIPQTRRFRQDRIRWAGSSSFYTIVINVKRLRPLSSSRLPVVDWLLVHRWMTLPR